MQAEAAGISMQRSSDAAPIFLARLLIAISQGIILYILYLSNQDKAWPSTDPTVMSPLVLVMGFVPLLVVSGLGNMDSKRLLRWAISAAAILMVLGFYDAWRIGVDIGGWTNNPSSLPSVLLMFFTGVGLFVAHALTLACESDGRQIARYPTYFEMAWKLAIQILFSGCFVGVLWLVLFLGSSLFMLVKLDFLKVLIEKPWFSIPITVVAFSSAIHITDVRPTIVQGIRTLLLVLNSWLLPLATLLAAGFLASLTVTGLAPLWATEHATAVLLGAAAVLVIFINAAFQNGEMESQVVSILRISARISAALLAPIVVIATYSLWLRIHQYGWSIDRVIAAACLLVAACYAAGYGLATLTPGVWLRRVSPTNIFTAFVVIAVLIALFSPIADPARISVSNQLGRLASGKVSVAKFDSDFLKFSGVRYGMAGLNKLNASTMAGKDATLLHDKIETTLKKRNPWMNGAQAANAREVLANINVWPRGSVLPESFLSQDWSNAKEVWSVPACLTLENKTCDAYLIDLNGDGKPEILIMGNDNYQRAVVFSQKNGTWSIEGSFFEKSGDCKEEVRSALSAGNYKVVPPLIQDI